MVPDIFINDVLAMVAHDLRNPLTCIEGYAASLQSVELSDTERAETLGRILSCTRWATTLVSDLMDSIAIEKGKLTLNRRVATLDAVVREAIEPFEFNLQKKNIRLDMHISRDPIMVLVDTFRVRQALQNILGNALKHASEGGHISVNAYHCGDGARIEVEDDGAGIDPADQHRIFEKFFRRGELGQGGLGLGLFIAKAIVEEHGGSIGVRSEGLGQGSTFFLHLPVFQPEKAYQEFKARKSMDTPPPRLAMPTGRATGEYGNIQPYS